MTSEEHGRHLATIAPPFTPEEREAAARVIAEVCTFRVPATA